MNSRYQLTTFTLSARLKMILYVLMLFGLATFIAGLFQAPERIWPNYLIAEVYLLSLALGATFFIAVQYVTNAGWSVAFRRIPESLASTLPVWGLGALILIFGIHSLYEWSHPDAVAADEILRGKSGWLNLPFFIGRLVFYFLIWIGLSRSLIKNSLRQDESGGVDYTHKNVRNSAIFLVLGVITFCWASIDLIMSVQPHWYSTVFSFIALTGMFLSGLAIITIFVVLMRYAGYRHIFTTEHLHDLGKLLMSFSVFWVYMWVSQHLLIWYSNLPEETSYYIFRHFGGWGSLSFLNVILNWLIPFLVLLPRSTKRNDKIMLQVAIVVLIGHWLDLYIMIMPVFQEREPVFGLWEIGPLVGMLALFFFLSLRFLSRKRILPVKDPYLIESLPHY